MSSRAVSTGAVTPGSVHVVLPAGVDDPRRPSGGNVYDRRVCRDLAAAGWSVHEHPVTGSWPRPATDDLAGLQAVLSACPDRAVVLVDGLVGSAAPQVLVPQADRLRLVLLVHLPLDGEAAAGEDAVLTAAAAVVTSSPWARNRLLERLPALDGRLHVAEPGVDRSPAAPGSADGGSLLCVAAVAPHKGHDLLLSALADLTDLSWRCTCVGSLERDAGFADRMRARAGTEGLAGRVLFRGPLTGAALEAAYADADVLVHPSRGETYAMVVTEALARGLPVVATAVGGLPETLRGAGGPLPGLLVPPEDPAALTRALRHWLQDAELRRRLRAAAGRRRPGLAGWSQTADRLARVLAAAR
jgi:glycosyltransferase involved in cell wall biosynthesis